VRIHRRNRAETMRELCRERGLKIRLRGAAFHVVGVGVDILCADLASLSKANLTPKTGNTDTSTAARRRVLRDPDEEFGWDSDASSLLT